MRLRKFCFRSSLLLLMIIILRMLLKPCQKCSTSSPVNGSHPIYIFDTIPWRNLIVNNKTEYCTVPNDLIHLSKELCSLYNNFKHDHLPCTMVYSDQNTPRRIQCFRNGRIRPDNQNSKAETTTTPFSCYVGYSLDLFRKTNPEQSYPSLMFYGFTRYSPSRILEMLNSHYRSLKSVWAFHFNLEPISRNPWTGDKAILNFFNFTYGYNRKIYDFIAPPWMTYYISSLVQGRSRMTVEKAMNTKKPIISQKRNISYWPNSRKVCS